MHRLRWAVGNRKKVNNSTRKYVCGEIRTHAQHASTTNPAPKIKCQSKTWTQQHKHQYTITDCGRSSHLNGINVNFHHLGCSLKKCSKWLLKTKLSCGNLLLPITEDNHQSPGSYPYVESLWASTAPIEIKARSAIFVDGSASKKHNLGGGRWVHVLDSFADSLRACTAPTEARSAIFLTDHKLGGRPCLLDSCQVSSNSVFLSQPPNNRIVVKIDCSYRTYHTSIWSVPYQLSSVPLTTSGRALSEFSTALYANSTRLIIGSHGIQTEIINTPIKC